MKKLITSAILATSMLPQTTFAWGDMGHKIVGALAEKMIKSDTRAFVRGILGVEPLYLSATFPDEVRDDERFGHKDPNPTEMTDLHDFSSYHFCEIPDGETYATAKPARKDCHGLINNARTVISSKTSSREEKMISMKYLIHVIGDIHQPLHVGNGLDRGANACTVIYNGKKTGLHSFWDTSLVNRVTNSYPGKPKYIGPVVTAMMTKFQDSVFTNLEQMKAQAYDGGVDAWLADSQALRAYAYPDETPVKSPKERLYCAWYQDQDAKILGEGSPDPKNIDPLNIPKISSAWATQSAAIVEKQLVKAALRLARTLDQLAEDNPDSPRISDETQEQIFKNIDNMFSNKTSSSNSLLK